MTSSVSARLGRLSSLRGCSYLLLTVWVLISLLWSRKRLIARSSPEFLPASDGSRVPVWPPVPKLLALDLAVSCALLDRIEHLSPDGVLEFLDVPGSVVFFESQGGDASVRGVVGGYPDRGPREWNLIHGEHITERRDCEQVDLSDCGQKIFENAQLEFHPALADHRSVGLLRLTLRNPDLQPGEGHGCDGQYRADNLDPDEKPIDPLASCVRSHTRIVSGLTKCGVMPGFPSRRFPLPGRVRPVQVERPTGRTTWTGRTRSGGLRCASGEHAVARHPRVARVQGRTVLAAGGHSRVVGLEALPAGGTSLTSSTARQLRVTGYLQQLYGRSRSIED